ncbi:DUF1810 domain-containing protein [Flavobacterium frigidarium]|uniref:DUF1810 family protein n=1 Tax=Flavobacterium frigidarium TaxID=99286 RepID=A0ABV4KED1_9FLAO
MNGSNRNELPATNTRLANLVELPFRITFSLSVKLSHSELPTISKRQNLVKYFKNNPTQMKGDLIRFKTAQDTCLTQVLEEMKNGKKKSHWMWFVFPQIAGLGKSTIAKKYEIVNIEEAEDYLKDELLSKRLIELTKILAYDINGKTAEEIFGFPDYLKFHSSITLFYSVVRSNRQFENNSDLICFEDTINKYYDGKLDKVTLRILKNRKNSLT